MKMKAISYTSARNNLARTINEVCEDHDPVIITRRNRAAVIMLSLEDYESLNETGYLLKSPKNAKRLLASIYELGIGKGTKKDLVE